MTITLDLPPELVARLAAAGFTDKVALNAFAVASLGERLDTLDDSYTYTNEDDAALASAITRVEQGHNGKPASAFFAELHTFCYHAAIPKTVADDKVCAS